MSNGLKKVNDLLNYIEEYTKKTGREPVVTISKSLLEEIQSDLQRLDTIDNANPSEALMFIQELLDISETEKHFMNLANYDIRLDLIKTKQALLKAQEQEKENELLKEIIKILFDGGCPLHQYVDKDFGLTIEVDKEFSIMHLGEFKGVNLDEKLKEVLECNCTK